jgi:hypothetical protein
MKEEMMKISLKRRQSEDVSEFGFWREQEIFLLSTNSVQILGQRKFSE